jgi:hypothetical protein
MGFRACPGRDDPFEKKVRETYGANVVGAPRAGIVPLITVARQDDRVEPRGHLRHILDGEPTKLPKITSSPAAAMSGTRSSELKASLGLDLSSKFLTALGLPVPGAELTASLWDGASKFMFEVRDVVEDQVDIAKLGRAVDGHAVADNAATSIFLNDPSQELFVITRTLTSPTFAIRATTSGGQAVNVAVDGIAELVGAAHADVSWKQEKDSWVTFRGADPVTFGFSVVPCVIDAGRRLTFGLTRKGLKFGPPTQGAPVAPRPVIAEDARAGLLSFD